MARKVSRAGENGRVKAVLALLVLAAAVLVHRLVQLQVDERENLVKLANLRIVRPVYEGAMRGIIMDREGEPLAISTPMGSLGIDPKMALDALNDDFKSARDKCPDNPDADALCAWVMAQNVTKNEIAPEAMLQYRIQRLAPFAQALGMSGTELETMLEKNSVRRFLYLKRQLPPQELEMLLNFKVPAVVSQDGFKRFYPDGELLGQIVGYTDIDDRGQEGIERQYDDWLSGQKGKMLVVVSANKNRRAIRVLNEEIATAQGQNLQLSIDKRIQYQVRRVLLDTMNEFKAKSVSAVMVDVKTGEVLAMVSLPDGNPNIAVERKAELMKNHMATDIFEPGSTIKPIAVASALQAKVISTRSIFPTKGELNIGKNVVRDTHNYGTLDTTGVIRKSSNVGMAMISEKMPRAKHYAFMKSMGFGEQTAVHFPGEGSGLLRNPAGQNDFSYATTFFGYGISTTALQLAQAYAAIANHGVKVPLTLIKRNAPVQGEQVIDPKIADAVLKMMETVVQQGGTGTRANTESYTVAGKTGTSHKVTKHGYSKDHYRALFAGVAPASNPRIALVVVVDDPRSGEYYGGLVAAPAFSAITESSLKILGVLPDKINKSGEVHLDVDGSVFDDNDSAGLFYDQAQ